jgi:hypothetical protein
MDDSCRLTPETIWKQPQTLNRYVYTANDPINYTDESGLGPEPEPGEAGIDPNCVEMAIRTKANQLGINLEAFSFETMQIAGINGAAQTELRLSGSFFAIIDLVNQMCDAAFYSNGLLECGEGSNGSRGGPGGRPHGGFDTNFRSSTTRNSLQVNTSIMTGMIELDIDQFNPADGAAGLIGHLLQVGINAVLRQDNKYHCD